MRAEQFRGMLAPFEERARLEARQAQIENELERLHLLQPNTGGSENIRTQIADLERELATSRRVKAPLNEREAVAKNTVARLSG